VAPRGGPQKRGRRPKESFEKIGREVIKRFGGPSTNKEKKKTACRGGWPAKDWGSRREKKGPFSRNENAGETNRLNGKLHKKRGDKNVVTSIGESGRCKRD